MVPEDFLSVLRASKLYFENNTHIVCEAKCQSKHKNVKTLLVSTPKNVSNEEIKYFQILERYSEEERKRIISLYAIIAELYNFIL